MKKDARFGNFIVRFTNFKVNFRTKQQFSISEIKFLSGNFKFEFLSFFFRRLKIVTGSTSQILQVENLFENIENLTVDLMYKTRGEHCYAIVTDKIYQSILSANLFKSVSQSTYLIIFVPEFADTLRPEPIFLLSLMQAQLSGCRTFLIYLANGIQMERFLRFVDQ